MLDTLSPNPEPHPPSFVLNPAEYINYLSRCSKDVSDMN